MSFVGILRKVKTDPDFKDMGEMSVGSGGVLRRYHAGADKASQQMKNLFGLITAARDQRHEIFILPKGSRLGQF